MSTATGKKRRARPSSSPGGHRFEAPTRWALAALAIWSAILLLAPPESNLAWSMNGFRSIPAPARFGLLLAAAALGAVASLRVRAASIAGAIALFAAWGLAYPLREKIHLLGDSSLRFHAIHALSDRSLGDTAAELFGRLHATPLDAAINFGVPLALLRAGVGVADAISLLSLALALLYFAGVWRLAARLAREPGMRLNVALALALTGALGAFAGYSESTGLLLALAPWWWAEVLAPLSSRSALRMALAWCVLILAHRLSLVMILPMLWRALGPALAGDRPEGRRALVIATLVAAVVALAILRLTVGSSQMSTDVADAFALFRGERGVGLLPLHDMVNLIALVAPLAFLAPLVAGGGALRSWLGTPEARLVLIAALPLAPLAMLLPAGPHGFGAHRDWDLAVLFGWTATLAGVGVCLAAPPARALGALRALVPVLALGAGAWVAVNADEPASIRRALALASRPPLPAPPHLAALHLYLGQRAMDRSQFGLGGRYYEKAYDLSPNPRYLLLAAEARLMAGETTAARADVERARASRGLNASGLEAARRLDEMIGSAASDSVAAPP